MLRSIEQYAMPQVRCHFNKPSKFVGITWQ